MRVADLLDTGRIELLEVLFGLHRSAAGGIKLKGKEIRSHSTREAIHDGFALCTEEWRFNGIFPDLSISFNTVISQIKSYTNHFG